MGASSTSTSAPAPSSALISERSLFPRRSASIPRRGVDTVCTMSAAIVRSAAKVSVTAKVRLP